MEGLSHAESSVENVPTAAQKNLFRLMKLVRETQCDMEVVKPVLDELEVMRLCCSIGMMPSVNVKDFNYGALHAREFDDDFIRFLRADLLGNSCSGYVNLTGLFGKQAQVSEALIDMQACSKETVASMAETNEGIYCVKTIGEYSEGEEDGDEKSGLVVFSWIRDVQFEPQRLRDTPAFVLRFLTGLSSDIICCTSPSDMEQIKTVMVSSNDQVDEELSSYSVSFRIEKQEDQPDSTECMAVSPIDLESVPDNCLEICLVKGSYPAIAITRTMSSAIRTESFRRTFHCNTQVSFASWLKVESKHSRIDLSPGIVRSVKLCRNILKEFEMWPEDEVNACQEAQAIKQREHFDAAAMQVKAEIAERKSVVDAVSKELFMLRATGTSSAESDAASQTAFAAYKAFQEWLESICSWKIDRKMKLSLDAPMRLNEITGRLFELYSRGHEGEMCKMIEMCATASRADLLKHMKKCDAEKKRHNLEKLRDGEEQTAMWQSFLETSAGPFVKLHTKWWIALESVLAAVSEELLKDLKREEKHAKTAWYDEQKVVIKSKLDELRKTLLSSDGLLLSVNAHTRGQGTVHCEGTKEIHAPPTIFYDIVKLKTQKKKVKDAVGRQEFLGRLLLEPNKNHVAIFTVKVRSAVHICTGTERMEVKLVYFPADTDPCRPPRASEKTIRTFGKFASDFDYDVRNRILTFISEASVGIYKFDESFKQLDCMKRIDLDVRSTLTALPFTDILLLDSTVYVTDSSGGSQGIDIHNDQTSSIMSVHAGTEVETSHSRLLGLADNLAVGVVSCTPTDDGAFEGNLECIARDGHRQLPILPLGVKFLTDRVSVQCVDDKVFVLDPLAQKVYEFSIRVSVRSDSYRLRQSDTAGSNSDELESNNADCPRKQHWMYTFYHVFEKFPVRGSMDCSSPSLVSLLIACPGVEEVTTALESCHDFLSLLMSDLMELNKPLHGLDLTKGLAVQRSLHGMAVKSKSIKSFFQTLITFLPVQICRAEGNALTVLHDGMDPSLDELDVDIQTWGAADIAESIRFGLLSPLLCAWRGRCVVITSMGKQSTGKSYFLNHLTGSSFAIAGNRCTDGAWMTLRILQDILLVVLDFEGVGSFERTDQEDVFLSVLNASLSMFTIFRMEMRFDKDIEGLFTKFQKGINLLKNDGRFFQGSLYMSVKDVNPNDRHGVLAEFQRKIQKLLTANCENFLTEMYSGALGINSSPPLGTSGYYGSVRHARRLIENLINDSKSLRGFKSGSSFHDCIRLVLAKISILDWTAVDKSSQRLEMNELHRKLPGAIRTGCVIPVDAQTKDGNLPQYLKDPLLHDGSAISMLTLKELSRDYPDFSESWAKADQALTLDNINDEDIDFGPSVCIHGSVGTNHIHFTLSSLFQRYLALISKGPLEKIVDEDYANFDAMLSFLVRRRKKKVILWVKQFLGAERFLDEWEQIEQTYFLPFEAQFQRCLHSCAKCQLSCMRSVCHVFNEEHDCGMSHVCRGLCEYCMRNYQPGKEMPRCVGKAGHEGKCDCVKGDHTCGAECSLVGASNCGGLCVLLQGHEENHRCSVKQHACGAACSATNCGGKCILNIERCHTVHKCPETQCIHMCEMDSCKKRCSSANHFHDQLGLWTIFTEENGQTSNDATFDTVAGRVIHLCNSRHACTAACEAEGVCTKTVQVSTKKFSGACDTFDFELKEMVAVRNQCAIVLPQGKTNHHSIPHSCEKLLLDGTKTIHGCGVRCSACEYYCDKPIGHVGEHSAAHGNMRNMHFVAQDRIISWGDRKYEVGEKGIAEMCNMFCSSAGRGHVHYLKCDKDTSSRCVYSGLQDQRRHCTLELKPHPAHEVDEVLHAQYWKTMGWEDPCRSAAERVLFGKCPYLCDAPEHRGEGKVPSYCDLDVWHDPVSTPSIAERRGFTFVGGHRFVCSHTTSTGKLLHVFVLDCSGSMRGTPWYNLVRGVRGYLTSRMASGATQDVVSVVTFGDHGTVEYENVAILSARTRRIPFHGGGTFYSNGLSQANALFSRAALRLYKPVLIFFTDGRPADRMKGLKMARDIRTRYAAFGLRSFVVGYGRASDMGLAELADQLGGSVHEALAPADLGETFRSISLSLGARAGLLPNTT